MPLFTAKDHARIVAGEFRVTYRLWKTPHVTTGKTYPTGFGGAYIVDDVRIVKAGEITNADAWSAGCPDAASLLELVGAHTKAKVTRATKLYRIAFRFDPEEPAPPPRLDEKVILQKLEKLDALSPHGPWTLTALRLIEQNPRVLARLLAREAGIETLDFKVNIRKLKKLGLTHSHLTGYELTDLGQSILDLLVQNASPSRKRR